MFLMVFALMIYGVAPERAVCKGFLGMKSARREVWQLFSDTDRKFVYSFDTYEWNYDVGDDVIEKVLRSVDLVKIAPRHKFASGRIFRPESDPSAAPYVLVSKIYSKRGDCENTKKYTDIMKKAYAETKLLILSVTGEVYDPVVDIEIFPAWLSFQSSFFSTASEVLLELCKKGNAYGDEFDSFFLTETMNRMPPDNSQIWAIEERLGVHEKLPREEAEMYMNFLDFSARAYNAANPDEALRIAAGQKEFIDKRYKSFKFESGREYREESTFLLDAYVSEARAYADKGDCERAKSALAKFNEIAAKDYLVIDYFYFKVYDAALDAAVYAEKKKHNVQILLMSLPRSACFD